MSSGEDIQQGRGTELSQSLPAPTVPLWERAAMLGLGLLYAGTFLAWLLALGWACKWLLGRIFA
jgi:hypothetical protein